MKIFQRALGPLAGAVALALAPAYAQPSSQNTAAEHPKLLLTIVVDQFRLDYFYRWKDQYHGGLAKLYKEGAFYTNAFYEHFPTVTAIGHSTVLSGATPSISGIVGNEWYDRVIGGRTAVGSSPHNLLVSTIPDEIKMSGRFASKSVGISIKDRSAILPNGRMGDASYWFDNDTGNMVSSTYYFEDLPAWVKTFNESKTSAQWCGQEWRPVTAGAAEALFKMPAGAGEPCYSAMERSPYGNELLEAFAEQAIVSENLGQGDRLDVLSVSFSSNDYVGHRVGPDDPQVRDISIRTDQLLDKFFRFIDQKVGLQNVIVAFTADHGVAPLPEMSQQRKMPGGRLPEQAVLDKVEQRLSQLYGAGKWVVGKSGPAPYLDYDLIASKNLDRVKVRQEAADVIRTSPHIYRVYTRDQLASGHTLEDMLDRRVRAGFHSQRAADLFIVVDPYFLFEKSGTSHGTPFNYDAHVPLVLMGPGIKSGRYHQRAAVNDIAPTLATLLEIEIPSGAVGRVLLEALR